MAWSDAEKLAFLQQQFDAQHAHWQRHYNDTDWLVVMHGGEPVGRLMSRWPREPASSTSRSSPSIAAGAWPALLKDLLARRAVPASRCRSCREGIPRCRSTDGSGSSGSRRGGV